uniref:Lipoprotein n=1 Tax=Macrostomum lignano TaxID=282301 RepID=A0A1I8G1R7_9PLAT
MRLILLAACAAVLCTLVHRHQMLTTS